ncbi:hypothetical protein C8F01DRAFT_1085129 [Mycena amicta]|nr:hypothetical protein C8F01DRAFT_1085129 [Mycena amicta]
MVPPHRHTKADKPAGRRASSLKYDHSEHGRTVRRERVRTKRRIAKTHISRIRLPDLVEDWACADLRTNYAVFEAAHTPAADFDESEFTHWLQHPPFNLAAIALTEDPSDYDDHSNWYVSCAVDGCLLRREQQREAQLKEKLGRIGKKEIVDNLRKEVRALLEGDWAEMQGMGSIYQPGTREHTLFFSTPPTSDDRIRLQDLWHDPELPHGRMRSVVDALNEKHWQITLAGRIVSVVEALDERYLVIEALPGNQMLEDFKELVWALGRLQERTTVNVKVTNSWTRLGTNGWASGLIYVHLTSTTRLKTHAWERDESWVVAPTLIEPALSNTRIIDPIESGASRLLCRQPPAHRQHTPRKSAGDILSRQQWVIKSSFLGIVRSTYEMTERDDIPANETMDQGEIFLVYIVEFCVQDVLREAVHNGMLDHDQISAQDRAAGKIGDDVHRRAIWDNVRIPVLDSDVGVVVITVGRVAKVLRIGRVRASREEGVSRGVGLGDGGKEPDRTDLAADGTVGDTDLISAGEERDRVTSVARAETLGHRLAAYLRVVLHFDSFFVRFLSSSSQSDTRKQMSESESEPVASQPDVVNADQPAAADSDTNGEVKTGAKTKSSKGKAKSKVLLTKRQRLERNRRCWAEGRREEEILKPQQDAFRVAKLSGKAALKTFFKLVQNEFIFKIGWRLEDWEEPEGPLPDYDPTAPPVIEELSDEDEALKDARIELLCVSVKNWYLNRERATKKPRIVDAPAVATEKLPKVKGVDDAVIYVANRLRLPPPKRATAGHQQFMREAFASEIGPVVAERWAARLGPDSTQAERNEKPPPHMGAKVALELYQDMEKTDPERHADLKKRGTEVAEQEKMDYKQKLQDWPDKSPDARQMAYELIEPLMRDYLKAVADTLGMHIFAVIGGPVPKFGGDIRTVKISIGTNNAPSPVSFPEWDKEHWEREINQKFIAYLETAYTPAQRRAAALPKKKANAIDILDDSSLIALPTENDNHGSRASSSNSKSTPPTDDESTPDDVSKPVDDDDSDNQSSDEESDPAKAEQRAYEEARAAERARQAQIAKNKKLIADLGLGNAAALLGIKTSVVDKPPPKRRAPRKPVEASGPLRRSSRTSIGTAASDSDVSMTDGGGGPPPSERDSLGTDDEPMSIDNENPIPLNNAPHDPMDLDALAASVIVNLFPAKSSAPAKPTVKASAPSSTTPASTSGGGLRRLLALDALKTDIIPSCPPAAAEWLRIVWKEFTGQNLGTAYNAAIRAYAALEAEYGYVKGGGKLSTQHRPKQVSAWIQHARVAKPTYCGIADTGTDNGRPGSAARKGESWDLLIAPGINGMLNAMVMLYWWGCEDQETGAWPTKDWIEAVEDVTRVCESLQEEEEEKKRAKKRKTID